MSGGFVWTGFDYRGEPSPNGWPNISSQYGIIDTCGFPKDSFYYYQSWWRSEPVLHVFPHWNWSGMEGKEIAVWVYSNLDKVELFVNGQSLGAKDVKKDSHLAWVVKYTPGTIEARGFKDGKQVMTAKRETTGPAAKLVMTSDRKELSADGEDVAMFAVAVQDAQGRVVPITDNEVTFKVSGAGKLIGVGNGDPTDQASDKGQSRKAFSGYCMGVVQATKRSGTVTVEVTSPGIGTATVTIPAKSVELRPQVAVWEREIPSGSGITGLWRPVPQPGEATGIAALILGGTDAVYTLQQEGGNLTGTVEGGNISFFGGNDVPVPITEGKVEGDQVSFKVGKNTYSGTQKGDRLEMQRTIVIGWEFPKPAERAANAPDIGPPPDGSDPSINPSWHIPPSLPLLLQRAQH